MIRGTSTRFTFDPVADHSPVWSPDGSQIVFASSRDGAVSDLYQKNSNGVMPEEALLKSDSFKLPEHWSADGRFLLYRIENTQTRPDLWALPMMGEKKPQAVVRSQFSDIQGRFSYDSQWIAYVSDESGRPEIYVQGFPTAGAKFQISTSGGYQPRWRKDGKELFFISPSRDVMAVDITVSSDGALKAGVPHKLFTINPINLTTHRNSWDVTPDGQQFVVNSFQQATNAVLPITVVVNWQRGRKSTQ